MLIIKFLIVFIIVLLFCQLFLATVQEGFEEGVDDNSCSPGVNQIPLLQDQVKTLQNDVSELKNNVQALNDVSNNEYKTDINQDELNANANTLTASTTFFQPPQLQSASPEKNLPPTSTSKQTASMQTEQISEPSSSVI